MAELPHDGILIVQRPAFIINAGFTPGSNLFPGDINSRGTSLDKEPVKFEKYIVEFWKSIAHSFFHFEKAVKIWCKNALVDKMLIHKMHLLSDHKNRSGL
jgi:hypothetical protein